MTRSSGGVRGRGREASSYPDYAVPKESPCRRAVRALMVWSVLLVSFCLLEACTVVYATGIMLKGYQAPIEYTKCAAWRTHYPLSEAARSGDLERVRHLLRQDKMENAKSFAREQALFMASVCGRSDVADELLQTDLDLKNSVIGGMPFVIVLAEVAEPSIFSRILDTGRLNVNEADKTYGFTALHSLACNEKMRTQNISVLLSHGATKELKSKAGDTSLMVAVRCKNREAQAILR